MQWQVKEWHTLEQRGYNRRAIKVILNRGQLKK